MAQMKAAGHQENQITSKLGLLHGRRSTVTSKIQIDLVCLTVVFWISSVRSTPKNKNRFQDICCAGHHQVSSVPCLSPPQSVALVHELTSFQKNACSQKFLPSVNELGILILPGGHLSLLPTSTSEKKKLEKSQTFKSCCSSLRTKTAVENDQP